MVKKITHEQSRRNITRRGRRVAARHARAGRWAAQPRPMLGSGAVRYEVGANIDATGFGGIAAVHRLVTRLGWSPGWGWSSGSTPIPASVRATCRNRAGVFRDESRSRA